MPNNVIEHGCIVCHKNVFLILPFDVHNLKGYHSNIRNIAFYIICQFILLDYCLFIKQTSWLEFQILVQFSVVSSDEEENDKT